MGDTEHRVPVSFDAEIIAMGTITEQLDGLDSAQRVRVLAWAHQRYVDGDREGVHATFKAWTDEIAEKARAIGVQPGEMEHAALALIATIESQRAVADGPAGIPAP